MDVKNKTNSAVHLKSEEETSYILMSMFPLNQDITEKKKKNHGDTNDGSWMMILILLD